MKTKFSSFDIACIVNELQKSVVGLRVVNVYDINNKCYIIKLGQEKKTLLYIESGSRLHTTAFEWPKQMMPSAFSAKCRRVMRNKRVTSITQMGCDRVIDLQFGAEEFSSHLMVELYDRGNVCLCDSNHVITAILRTRQDAKEDVRYAVGHFYPRELCQTLSEPNFETLKESIGNIKPNTQLKRFLNYQNPFSIPLIDHCLHKHGLNPDQKISVEYMNSNIDAVYSALQDAFTDFTSLPSSITSGFIFSKSVTSKTTNSLMDEFHPVKFRCVEKLEVTEYPSYNDAVDTFFYKQETQKIESKSVQQEKSVLKKLETIKLDHESRIKNLREVQEVSSQKAYLIEVNLEVVEEAITIVQNLIANRLSWEEIDELVEEGRENDHAAALAIDKISLDKNRMSMLLRDPYEMGESIMVDIDLDMGAYANAKRYYDAVKQSSLKEQKTAQSSSIALKNAEKKTEATIKDINIVASIKKARKAMWFEKFLWFISSEGYMIIGGRDAQQNEILVKKYLGKHDVYVHADIHGATSIIAKNKGSDPLPPKTLMEAGCFALCQSSAWNSKIVTSAYWVHSTQVSKTAPTGEYLTTGSFMIRGKKNFLPPAQHILGFAELFKVDEERGERRREEKKPEEASKIETSDQEEEEVVEEDDDGGSDGDVSDDQDDDKAPTGMDELFDKYNLQISALSTNQDNSQQSERTDFVGTPLKAHYKKKEASKYDHAKKQQESQQPQNNRPKRGQKSKKKRIEKYADQSDDEREAMMALLGSAGTKKQKEKGGKSSNSKQKYKAKSTAKNVVSGFTGEVEKPKLNEAERVEQALGKIPAAEEEDVKDDVKEEAKPDKTPSLSFCNKAPIDTKPPPSSFHNKAPVDIKPPPPPQEDDQEEGGSDNEEEKYDFLDSLILNPTPADTILFGVPFVAPYTVMSGCKYKAKLTPGTTKKGKACKTILDTFSRDKSSLPQERNVFKSLKDVDMTVNIPGKVKISAPNLHGHGKRK